MDISKLRQSEKIAAGSAVALLLILFILDWFGLKFESSGIAGGFAGGVEGSKTGWGSMDLIRFIILLACIAAITMAYFSATGQQVALPVALSAIVAGLGILSVVLILFRIISPPDLGAPSAVFDAGVSHTRKIGAFLGLIAAAGVAYGGYSAMQDEGTSFSDARDQLQDRMGGPGSGPGAGGGTGSGGTPPSSGGTPPSSGGTGEPPPRA